MESLLSNEDEDRAENEVCVAAEPNIVVPDEERKQDLRSKLWAYYDEGTGVPACRNVSRDVRCAVRDYLVSKVKFVDVAQKRTFPSFLQHDFTDSRHFITKFLSMRI